MYGHQIQPRLGWATEQPSDISSETDTTDLPMNSDSHDGDLDESDGSLTCSCSDSELDSVSDMSIDVPSDTSSMTDSEYGPLTPKFDAQDPFLGGIQVPGPLDPDARDVLCANLTYLSRPQNILSLITSNLRVDQDHQAQIHDAIDTLRQLQECVSNSAIAAGLMNEGWLEQAFLDGLGNLAEDLRELLDLCKGRVREERAASATYQMRGGMSDGHSMDTGEMDVDDVSQPFSSSESDVSENGQPRRHRRENIPSARRARPRPGRGQHRGRARQATPTRDWRNRPAQVTKPRGGSHIRARGAARGAARRGYAGARGSRR